VALPAISPDQAGRVETHGEIWKAVAGEPIAEGEKVRVEAVDGLTLTVRRETAAVKDDPGPRS
jgi:membrane-bound serine protease (ClpP class)